MLKFKENQLVTIIDCTHGHNFKIGEVVKIVELITDSDTPHYKAVSTIGKLQSWYIEDNEIQAIKSDTLNKKK